MRMLQFFFPTPYTPVSPGDAMDVPYGAPVGAYNLMTYGLRDSGVRWGQVADYDELHAAENAPHYAGPLQYVQGTVIQSGSWQNRRGPHADVYTQTGPAV